jgi:hypothetical protein
MGVSVFPAPSAASKTMFRTTLTSGTSYTVPAGVTYLNVTLYGGGGGGGGWAFGAGGVQGSTGGSTTFTGATTAVGGVGGEKGSRDNGYTGNSHQPANSAKGGNPASPTGEFNAQGFGVDGAIISSTLSTTPGASISYAIGAGGARGTGSTQATGGDGGSGKIDIEYWV